MIAWLRKMWRRHVVADCPPALDACESCDWRLAIHCTEWQAAVCEARLTCIRDAKKNERQQGETAMTIGEAREALTDKIDEIAWNHAADKEIAAFEKVVREDERTQGRLRMHRLLHIAIAEAEKIDLSCIPGLQVAEGLVDP